MEEYHYVWLASHPDRDEKWLRDKLYEGFDVHHLDGNHSNNDPNNLVLVEHEDHMRLHNLRLSRLSYLGRKSSQLAQIERLKRRIWERLIGLAYLTEEGGDPKLINAIQSSSSAGESLLWRIENDDSRIKDKEIILASLAQFPQFRERVCRIIDQYGENTAESLRNLNNLRRSQE
jgi:hypothetical protein